MFAAPGVALLSFLVLRAEGSGIPAPRFETLQVLGLALIFLLAGALEEIGWSAFLLRRLKHQQRPWSQVSSAPPPGRSGTTRP